MGIPYSREISAAFDQVTPLVAAGFEVLQTTKNIAILLACIQVLTAVVLCFILLALLGLLYTVNPELEKERRQLVTPMMIWLASWVYKYGTAAKWLLRIFLVVSAIGFASFLWQGTVAGVKPPTSDDDDSADAPQEGKEKDTEGKGK
jgi:hypothetical protein